MNLSSIWMLVDGEFWNQKFSPGTPDDDDFLMPYYIVSGNAFPLQETIMKHFTQQNLDDEELIFNCRISRARHVVKNAFGIMTT